MARAKWRKRGRYTPRRKVGDNDAHLSRTGRHPERLVGGSFPAWMPPIGDEALDWRSVGSALVFATVATPPSCARVTARNANQGFGTSKTLSERLMTAEMMPSSASAFVDTTTATFLGTDTQTAARNVPRLPR